MQDSLHCCTTHSFCGALPRNFISQWFFEYPNTLTTENLWIEFSQISVYNWWVSMVIYWRFTYHRFGLIDSFPQEMSVMNVCSEFLMEILSLFCSMEAKDSVDTEEAASSAATSDHAASNSPKPASPSATKTSEEVKVDGTASSSPETSNADWSRRINHQNENQSSKGSSSHWSRAGWWTVTNCII